MKRIPVTEDQVRELHKRYEEGATLEQCGNEVELTREGMRLAFRRYDLPVRDRGQAKRLQMKQAMERAAGR